MNRSDPILDGKYYHAYNRGNRKEAIFGDDSDYRSFLKKLWEAASKYKVSVVVYTLMPNHFHFVLVQTPGGSIQRLMNSIESSAAKRFDLKYGKVGHLFQGRYRYNRIDSDESLLIAARHIHLNPVAAGLVRHPEEWPYSDFAEFVRMADQVEGVLQLRATAEEGRLLQGRFPPCPPNEYIDFVRTKNLNENVLPPDKGILQQDEDVPHQVEGVLQPRSSSDEGRLLPGTSLE
jgi:putative transposase